MQENMLKSMVSGDGGNPGLKEQLDEKLIELEGCKVSLEKKNRLCQILGE